MKNNWIIFFFFFFASPTLFSQVHIGAELGLNLSGPIPVETSYYIGDYELAGRTGLFLEAGIAKQAAFRTGIYYDIQAFNVLSKLKPIGYWGAMHLVSCPLMGVYKAGIFQASLGPEVMVLAYSNTFDYNIPLFHIGLRTELALQVSKRFRLQVSASYDFIPSKPKQFNTTENTLNSLSLGVSLAYSFKIFKKRRVIYSPG